MSRHFGGIFKVCPVPGFRVVLCVRFLACLRVGIQNWAKVGNAVDSRLIDNRVVGMVLDVGGSTIGVSRVCLVCPYWCAVSY